MSSSIKHVNRHEMVAGRNSAFLKEAGDVRCVKHGRRSPKLTVGCSEYNRLVSPLEKL